MEGTAERGRDLVDDPRVAQSLSWGVTGCGDGAAAQSCVAERGGAGTGANGIHSGGY